MALVAYDYGSDSEGEREEETCNGDTENCKKEGAQSGTVTIVEKKVEHSQTSKNLFSKLPETKSFEDLEEDQIEDFIPKSKPVKEKQKVKITIPSLSQFKDDDSDQDEPESKKLKPSKGCGLMSLLPPVKGSVKTAKSFVPHVVANKSKVTATVKKIMPQKKQILKPKVPKVSSLSDAESEDEIELPETFDDEMWEKVCGRPKEKPVTHHEPAITQSVEDIVDIAPEPEKPYDGLDNQAFKELVGKTKRPIGNIKLIDINEEEILPDKDLWMTKSLTDPDLMAPKGSEEPVDPTKRKKHHITYLAQQAKANEQELAAAWAASKNNRLMSRAKYGF